MVTQFRKLLRHLTPMHTPQIRIERWGTRHDGGYAVPADLMKRANVLLTGGVAHDVLFEVEASQKVPGLKIGLFDHTIKAPPDHTPPTAKFHQLGLGPKDGGWLVNLETAKQLSGFEPGDKLVVKLDIENAEWSLIEHTPESFWKDVSILIIEFHSLANRKAWRMYNRVLEKLQKNLVPIHMHANNWARIADKVGIRYPEVLEMTYVNRKELPADFIPRAWPHSSPTAIDQPNREGYEDPIINYWADDGPLSKRFMRHLGWWFGKVGRWFRKRLGRGR
jgi:hypothetical protein